MTDVLTDSTGTGEIPRIPGEDRTVVLRTDVGEATQNIAGWDAGLPPRLRRSDAHIVNDDTEVFIGWPTGAEVVVAQKLTTGSRLYSSEFLRPPAPGPGPFPAPLPPDPNPPAPRPSVPSGIYPPIGPSSPPTNPPKPTPPPPPADLAAAQPIAPWERVAGADEVARLRRSVPYVIPANAQPWTVARHAKPAPLWARLALTAGGSMAAGAAIALVVLAVFW